MPATSALGMLRVLPWWSSLVRRIGCRIGKAPATNNAPADRLNRNHAEQCGQTSARFDWMAAVQTLLSDAGRVADKLVNLHSTSASVSQSM